jgi:membrane-associated protease RseP (regulator of RpoE activity)
MGYTPIAPEGIQRTPARSSLWLHALLFVASFVCTMFAGAQWLMKDITEITNATYGITYALLIMSFLTAHEFGHYIAARKHGVDASLPYFIPMPFLNMLPFGTMGAVIRTRSPIRSRAVLFDIGVSGPLAGFVVCLIILAVGFLTLPPKEYLYSIHPEYMNLGGAIPTTGMYFGDTLTFSAFRALFADRGFIPPMNEMYHYPFLCVGWFGLFVTALNMLPFGQLDGGHVLYALVGPWQHRIARGLWWTLFLAGVLSLLGEVQQALIGVPEDPLTLWLQQHLSPVLDPMVAQAPWLFALGSGWLMWALLIRFFIKIPHPVIEDPTPLSSGRAIVGWIAIAVLVLCFAPTSIYFVSP